jgi:predicted dehydrogenase
MSFLNRREFIQRGALLSAAMASLGNENILQAADDPVKPTPPSEKLRVAVVGVKSRGMSHVGGFAGRNGCEIVTICDCDEAVIGNAMSTIEKKQGKAPQYVKDIRKVIEDKSIDIVSIATPNHWHALAAIWALAAGKDVYVEKPVSHNVLEGRLIVNTARKYGKICQTGTQSRSNPGMRAAMEYIHSGKIGKVDLAYGTCYKPRKSIGKVTGEQAIPKTIDYDLWCGPAPKLPLMRKSLHYDWHWTWAYGNGDLGNQGIHEMDKARWGLGKMELPNSVLSLGGRFGYVDDGETANTQICLFDYADSHLVFEVRGLKTDPYKGSGVGNIWFGSEGMVVCPSYSGGVAYDKAGKEVMKFNGGGDQHHFDNFLKAVRSRKREDLNADILEGHLSSALCHLGNISYRLGAETTMSEVKQFSDYKPAQEAVVRMFDHLKDNQVDLKDAKGRVGVLLPIDPKSEKFTGNNAKANAMLTREYRQGFDPTAVS